MIIEEIYKPLYIGNYDITQITNRGVSIRVDVDLCNKSFTINLFVRKVYINFIR